MTPVRAARVKTASRTAAELAARGDAMNNRPEALKTCTHRIDYGYVYNMSIACYRLIRSWRR
jgi:hypothetical protein